MKALVYHGPGRRSWDDVPDPVVQQPTDAVVRVDAVTICGTDLHILKGDVPETEPGRILGHEAVGTVTAIGSAVTYDVFARAGETGALKVLLTANLGLQPVRHRRGGASRRH